MKTPTPEVCPAGPAATARLSDREIYAVWDRLENALVDALRREARIVQRWFSQNAKTSDFVRECARKALAQEAGEAKGRGPVPSKRSRRKLATSGLVEKAEAVLGGKSA